MSDDENNVILEKCETTLNTVQEYINQKLDPRKVSFFNNWYTLWIGITEDEYYNALSISSNEYFQINLKREPNAYFINNYFNEELIAWKQILTLSQFLVITKQLHTCVVTFQKQKGFKEAKDTFNRVCQIMRKWKLLLGPTLQRENVQFSKLFTWLCQKKEHFLIMFRNSNLPECRYRIFR